MHATIRLARTPAEAQAAPLTAEEHRQHAAYHLYGMVKPADGLSWWELSDGQRRRFLGLVHMAARASDLTAVRAAHEACAAVLATHDDESLRDQPLAVRAATRIKALNVLSTWERVLTTGGPETDARILTLVHEEQEVAARRNPMLRRPS